MILQITTLEGEVIGSRDLINSHWIIGEDDYFANQESLDVHVRKSGTGAIARCVSSDGTLRAFARLNSTEYDVEKNAMFRFHPGKMRLQFVRPATNLGIDRVGEMR